MPWAIENDFRNGDGPDFSAALDLAEGALGQAQTSADWTTFAYAAAVFVIAGVFFWLKYFTKEARASANHEMTERQGVADMSADLRANLREEISYLRAALNETRAELSALRGDYLAWRERAAELNMTVKLLTQQLPEGQRLLEEAIQAKRETADI